jgi:hypothetical protein
MIRAPLRPCRSCSRHVRATDTACPFCNAPLASLPAPAPQGPARRLSRAALFAFGTGAAVLTPALTLDCSSDETETETTCCPPYGHVPFDAAESPPEDAFATPDVQAGSGDAGDSSVARDAGSDAADGTSDAVVDAAAGGD